jgi:hypothetical protein
VGALQGTGDAGLLLNPLIFAVVRAMVVPVPPVAIDVDVVVEAGRVLVTAGLVVELDESLAALVVVGSPDFALLLQAPSTKTATAETRTGATRRTNREREGGTKGGYAHLSPYPGQECLGSSIPRRAT